MSSTPDIPYVKLRGTDDSDEAKGGQQSQPLSSGRAPARDIPLPSGLHGAGHRTQLPGGQRSTSGSTSANPVIPSSRPMYRCARPPAGRRLAGRPGRHGSSHPGARGRAAAEAC
jgi:hypothetical protein